MRFYEDYRVGERFETAARRVTSEEVDSFVEYIGVRNPLFLDEKHASRGPFGARILPGFLTQSLALGLLYQPNIIQYFLLVEARTRFLKPVHVGDSIHVRGRVTSKKANAKSRSGLLRLRTEILTQNETVAEMMLLISVLKGAYAPRLAKDSS